MKIGIIGAMEEEVTLLRDKIEKPPDHHHLAEAKSIPANFTALTSLC